MAGVQEPEETTETEKEPENVKNGTDMKPWEQHSGVIIIPRYDYNAPSSLLRHSHSGFLITCPIKREKSATKEAISILEKHVESSNSGDDVNCLEGSDTNVAAKRRKTSTDETDKVCAILEESKSTCLDSEVAGEPSKDDCSSPAIEETNGKSGLVLSLVKLTRSGLLLFTFPSESTPDTVTIVSNIIQSIESGTLKSPLWCHRVFPFQATCNLNEKELHSVVSKLVHQFVSEKGNKLARPVKFAVGYNRRGIEETEMKIAKSSKDGDKYVLLDRNKCLDVVASAVKSVEPDCKVDLKNPKLSILVELLPLSGVPNGSLVVAVSVLPQTLVTTKRRLSIKALLSDSKASNKTRFQKPCT